MPTMSEVIGDHTDLSDADQEWVRLLVSEWQLWADLSFSDLVLWVPGRDSNVYWAAAQIRPTTGPTSLVDDVVGDLIAYSPEHLVTEAFLSGRITGTSEGKIRAGIPVQVQCVPVIVDQRVIAVVEQHTSPLVLRSPSGLESSYLDSARALTNMVTRGQFPARHGGYQAGSPRVGDGYMRLNAEGTVTYASPNALSAYRRLGLIGDLIDEHLATITGQLLPVSSEPVDESVQSALSGRVARRVELVSGDAHLLVRTLPIMEGTERIGAVVLCRDVSDLRSRERELITKDATIREIHHRVKNNLQTVAALLRMQARRIESPEAKTALKDARARVASIAIVHETLSQAFDELVEFDKVVDGLLRMMGDLAAASGQVSAVRVGSFGVVSADMATSLSMVVTELCQNAIEHGLADGAGELRVVPARVDGWLHIEITDTGRGLPENFDLNNTSSLGLSIVTTLVAELEGSFQLGPNPEGRGTRAHVAVPVDRSPRRR